MSDKPVCRLVNITQDGVPQRADLQSECPGCGGELHGPTVRLLVDKPFGRNSHPCWTWNGDLVKPTLAPSIRVTGYRMSAEGLAMFDRGERPPDGERYPGAETCCHSFVRDGKIEFLSDCTHALAGQTVPLEPLE